MARRLTRTFKMRGMLLSLRRLVLTMSPDPFPALTKQKREKAVWLRETMPKRSLTETHNLKICLLLNTLMTISQLIYTLLVEWSKSIP